VVIGNWVAEMMGSRDALIPAVPIAVFGERDPGSACTSATWEPSHVLAAMGVPLARAVAALRLTVGPDNTDDEVDYLLSVPPEVVAQSRRARAHSSASEGDRLK
jgi:hypothetical protein